VGSQPAVTNPLRVLVVDDNRDQADTTALLVRCWGFEVQVAYDGTQALEATCAYRPHVLLVDIGMPAMDGYSLARGLRGAGLTEAVLVAVTGYADEAHRRQGQEAGFDHYLVKPVEPGELQSLLALVRKARDLGQAGSDLLRATDAAGLRGADIQQLGQVRGLEDPVDLRPGVVEPQFAADCSHLPVQGDELGQPDAGHKPHLAQV